LLDNGCMSAFHLRDAQFGQSIDSMVVLSLNMAYDDILKLANDVDNFVIVLQE